MDDQRLSRQQVAALRADAEQAAGEVFDRLWDPDVFPVDPFKLAEDYGADVHLGDIPEDVEGLFRPRGDKYDRDQIWVDTDSSRTRQRFSCAHELGHAVHDGEKARIDRRRDDVSTRGTDPHEVWANAFAAELLMPEYAVRQLWNAGADAAELARFFWVSGVAMMNRLKNLGLA